MLNSFPVLLRLLVEEFMGVLINNAHFIKEYIKRGLFQVLIK